ncbi:MAG: hypothetical protein M1818_005345 [Claussenomyces sp. TS43310]|nr:MAG: hypothetical protein M1818_005345 [Claussenomyces sp. TS43310]
MDEQVDRLVTKLERKLAALPPSERLLIAISGIPGSGKTTLASTVVRHLNARQAKLGEGVSYEPIAAFIPMDGYHLSRAQLSAMPNAEEAHSRRGAEFTFDGASFLTLVRAVRKQARDSMTVYAPSFDHAVKDPKANDLPIHASARIIVFEGNYLSLDRKPWNEAAALMDESWFVDVALETARRRLVERHVSSGICKDVEEADRRARENDLVNGKEILSNRIAGISETIRSREDEAWHPKTQEF